MKKLSLRPYPGEVLVTKDPRELRRVYKRYTKEEFAGPLFMGMSIELTCDGDKTWLVYYTSTSALVHELGHVVLDLFTSIRSDPRDGNGEPFCYMLDRLFLEATKK